MLLSDRLLRSKLCTPLSSIVTLLTFDTGACVLVGDSGGVSACNTGMCSCALCQSLHKHG